MDRANTVQERVISNGIDLRFLNVHIPKLYTNILHSPLFNFSLLLQSYLDYDPLSYYNDLVC